MKDVGTDSCIQVTSMARVNCSSFESLLKHCGAAADQTDGFQLRCSIASSRQVLEHLLGHFRPATFPTRMVVEEGPQHVPAKTCDRMRWLRLLVLPAIVPAVRVPHIAHGITIIFRPTTSQFFCNRAEIQIAPLTSLQGTGFEGLALFVTSQFLSFSPSLTLGPSLPRFSRTGSQTSGACCSGLPSLGLLLELCLVAPSAFTSNGSRSLNH